jgi:hypothetical protein
MTSIARRLPNFAGAVALLLASAASAAPERNGFRLEPASVPVSEILSGGPPRDGIPALQDPERVPPEKAPWDDDEMVIGVERNGEAAAYPIAILVWHELVNDTLGGDPVLVSYCPLCGTGMVFDRRVDGKARRFGVSGLLYQADMLLYDHETESLWSQIRSEAVTGKALGSRLSLLRSRMTSWGDWKATHPMTTVLSRRTGHSRAYGRSPYGDYATSKELYFPVDFDRRHHPKMPTLGLRLRDGTARAYPAAELVEAGGSVRDRFAGRSVRISYDPDRQTFSADAPDDVEIVEGFWFAWMAFHPESSVFTAPKSPAAASSAAQP